MLLTISSAILMLIFLVLCYFATKHHDYWRKRNIPYTKPVFLLGNYGEFLLLKKYLGQMTQSICQRFPKAPYVGAFYGTEPTLLVKDPDVIKSILVKDFPYFHGRENSKYSHREPILNNLFFTYGDTWKILRQNLTPTFSTYRMKVMFNFIEKCVAKFENILNEEVGKNRTIEVRHLMCRYTMNCIGSCAFGLDTEATGDTKNNIFLNLGKTIFTDDILTGMFLNVRAVWPGIYHGLGMKKFSQKVDDFFQNILNSVFESRKYNPSTRNDFADLLLTLRKEGVIKGDRLKGDTLTLKVDDEVLKAQCLGFFGAGYETTSTTLHYILYELAKNPKVHEKATEEVDEYLKLYNNKIDYNCLIELPYIEACIDEALRLYPIVGILKREALEEYKLPCGAILDKGVRIHIPIYHLHHDSDNFPEPETFKPERFLEEAKKDIKPYTYLPFGAGPRKCIGMRFAKMEMIPAIITVLKTYTLELSDDTPRTLEFSATTLLTRSTKEIRLKFHLRDDWQLRVFSRLQK